MGNRIDISEVGKRILCARKRKLLTQKELGERLDIPAKTISKWENGTVAPDITILENLTKVLDVSFDDLLSCEPKEVVIKKKKRSFYIFIVLLLIVTFIFSVVFVYKESKKDKWIAYQFNSLNDNYLVDAYIISNGEDSKLLFNKIFYKEGSIDVLNVDVKVYFNDEIIAEYYYDEDLCLLNEALLIVRDRFVEVSSFEFDKNNIDDYDFYLEIIYQTKNIKEQKDNVELGLT